MRPRPAFWTREVEPFADVRDVQFSSCTIALALRRADDRVRQRKVQEARRIREREIRRAARAAMIRRLVPRVIRRIEGA